MAESRSGGAKLVVSGLEHEAADRPTQSTV